MLEAGTALTDYLLTGLCCACVAAFLHQRQRGTSVGPPLFFAGFALSAAFGGTWHGFYSLDTGRTQALIWWASMVFGGLSAAALALTGAELLGFQRTGLGLLLAIAFTLAFGAYVAHDDRFLVSIVATTAGMAACITGLARSLRRDRTGAAMGIAGLLLAVLAAVGQQAHVALDPPRIDHNATYHLLLVPAMLLLFAGLRRLTPPVTN